MACGGSFNMHLFPSSWQKFFEVDLGMINYSLNVRDTSHFYQLFCLVRLSRIRNGVFEYDPSSQNSQVMSEMFCSSENFTSSTEVDLAAEDTFRNFIPGNNSR